ncbi:MAG TPA: substrate-binding domain-containing protein, partial [Chloroflexota bacterium]|nr:substrate-binding domain-containing protein [Chloroflexota bacterium]
DQLWDPAYKGKITSFDPRIPSVGTLVASGVLVSKGEDKLRSLYGDQQPVLTQDRRQLAEWLVRGQYPLALGEDQTALKDLSNGGVDVSQVKPLIDDDPASAMYSVATGAIGLVNKAPHPNATKLFLNWLLSQEGQNVYSKATTLNSLRTDVTQPLPPELTLDPKKTYLNTQIESNYSYFVKSIAVTKEAIK